MMRAINYLAERASVPTDWQSSIKNFLAFLVFALPVHALVDWTGSSTPAWMFGWAWGSLGTYHLMRNRAAR